MDPIFFQKLMYFGVVFMGFFSIMNPVAAISIFLTLTAQDTEIVAKKSASQATLTAFIVVVVFSFIGHYLLELFGVSFTALRLTGGVLVGLIGYDMLQGKHSAVSNPQKETIIKTIEQEASYAVTPLGVPLLAGPGVIITAMNFSSGGLINLLITVSSFGLLCVITYYVLVSGKQIKKILGASALKVITRMMGLILAVIGMQMLIEGIYSAIKEF